MNSWQIKNRIRGKYKVCLVYMYRQHNIPPENGLQHTTLKLHTIGLFIQYVYYSILKANSQV